MLANKPYYKAVRDVLAANIASGRLPEGTRLFTAAVADRLGISRPPARRALSMLEKEGVLRALDAKGFIVGKAQAAQAVTRNLHLLDLDLAGELTLNVGQASWERIFEKIEYDVMNCSPFGAYQISEAAVGELYKVSRTVVRDVLSRMQERGLIAKDRSSHWIAGPLSARTLDEAHEVRRLLEPCALGGALQLLDRDDLIAMRARVRMTLESGGAPTQAAIDRLESDLHQTCIRSVRNRRLFDIIGRSQLSHVINRLFGTYIGIHDESGMLSEHRLVFDHLILGDSIGAEAAMRHHLDADHARARARLKVLSVFGNPEIAPYLVRVH